MMLNYDNRQGESDIKIEGLTIWVHGRQFSDSTDYWDANWLNVTAHCGTQGSNVTVNGSIIHLSEISTLLSEVEKLNKNLTGKVAMLCMEPDFSIEIEAEKHGHLKMTVNITPDHLHQTHTFMFDIDQSYLPKLITACKKILEKYPIIGKC